MVEITDAELRAAAAVSASVRVLLQNILSTARELKFIRAIKSTTVR